MKLITLVFAVFSLVLVNVQSAVFSAKKFEEFTKTIEELVCGKEGKIDEFTSYFAQDGKVCGLGMPECQS